MRKKTTNISSLPQRRSLRLPGYDYSRAGAYFVTLCVEKRSALFGEIVGEEMQLNDAGRMVEQAWLELPQHYPGVKVDICQIMPDHFHGIVWLEIMDCEEAPALSLNDVIHRFKSFTTHLYIEGVANEGWPQFPGRLWQRSYFDHVIRNDQDLEDTRKYIVHNPLKWQRKTVDGDYEINLKRATAKRVESGFTLTELVVVIVIVGILAALGGQFIVAPVTGYVDFARRTRLVDQAEMALRRMQRDIRHALPNSIRIDDDGTRQYLEMLNTVDGGRYRRYPGPDIGDDILDFSIADTGFDVLGSLTQEPAEDDRLVVYNISSTGTTGNAYDANSQNMAVIGELSTKDHVNLDPVFNFANTSPFQRFFIVDQPMTYACEGGVLNRYDDYTIIVGQPTPPAVDPALVTRNVTGCSFSYNPGTSQRAGLVTLKITLAEQGETITLLHQVHVVNVP